MKMIKRSSTAQWLIMLVAVGLVYLARLFIPSVLAQNPLLIGDIVINGRVDIFDYNQLLTDFGKVGSGLVSDLDKNGRVDIFDYNTLLTNFGQTGPIPSPSPAASPSPSSQPATAEWVQFGHDAQRTNYTTQVVPSTWRYKWQWNGADANGKTQAGHLSVPNLIQPITGGNRVYMVANNTAVALDKNTGSVLWQRGSIGTLSSTPIYDSENIYVASGNNNLYKLNASTGATISNFTATSALNLAPLLAGNNLYVVSAGGILYKVDKNTMAKAWEYSSGSIGTTPPSYSQSRDAIIFVTQDLYVHAVNNADGTRKWRVKPTARNYTIADSTNNLTEALNGWPVIAELHGLVFVRYRLEWNTLWTWSPFPTTNSVIRSNFQSNPNQQPLFALSLDTGSQAFIANVGNGGAGDGGNLPMGPQPVISTNGGQEVAYVIWRNGLTCASGWCDGREDATMGEMVLDNTTVSGYSAGDVRFIGFEDIQTDEMMQITSSGSTIFHNHWLITATKNITNRGATLGGTFTNPIQTANIAYVIWRQASGHGCNFDTLRRYCSAGLFSYSDTRSYSSPGFYEYFDAQQGGSTPYTIVSNGQVLVKTDDGAIIALENGNPLADNRNPLQRLAGLFNQNNQAVLGVNTPPQIIGYQDAAKYYNQQVTVEGKILSAVNHRPKGIYLGFTDPHDGALLLRIFEKDIAKFGYDLLGLKGKTIKIKGVVTSYWPEGKDPEIVVTDPEQIEIL